MITVNTNLTSLTAQRSLLKSTNSMNTALQRMSTGVRINSSKDDAAGMAISNKLEYKTSSLDVANDNAQMGQSMLSTAEGSLGNINDMLVRIRDLTEQAANGIYGDDERTAMQAEIDALTEEIYRIKNTTEFNGKKILGTEDYTGSITSTPDIMMNNVTDIEELRNTGKVIGISSAKELYKIAELAQNGETFEDITLALTSNIDLTELGDVDGNGSNWIAIKKFSGTFNGNGYSIENMIINQPNSENIGFFGTVENGHVRNLNIENSKIQGLAYIGIISGHSKKNSIYENCSTNGMVICGKTSRNYSMAGGFIGRAESTTFKNCNADTTTMADGNYVGGFVGESRISSVYENCFSNGDTTGDTRTGGFAGQLYNTVTVKNCGTYTNVTANGVMGGFVGALGFDDNKTGEILIDNSFSSGITTKTGNDRCGGFSSGIYTQNISDKVIKITNCKTTSKIIDKSGVYNVGAFAYNYNGQLGSIESLKNNQYDESINEGIPAFYQASISYSDDNLKSVKGLKVPEQPNKTSSEKTNLQVGITSDENSVITVDTGFSLDNFKVFVLNEFSACTSLDKIDAMIAKVSGKLTEIGAVQNRLESTMESQEVQKTTLTSANSLIKDADIAEESANYVKNQILQQTTASLLATANQSPSIALQLV